jgi:Domain of unknown function (DUF4926)
MRWPLSEYEVVCLKRTIPYLPVAQGTRGTIVHVYPADPPGYEVEFMDSGNTIGVYTVSGSDLDLVSEP